MMHYRDSDYSDTIRLAHDILMRKQYLDTWDRVLTEKLMLLYKEKMDKQVENKKE